MPPNVHFCNIDTFSHKELRRKIGTTCADGQGVLGKLLCQQFSRATVKLTFSALEVGVPLNKKPPNNR